MTFQDGATLLSTTISLSLLLLITRLFRDLAIDWFRDNMLALRDELCQMNSTGVLEVDHLAYTMFQTTINGFMLAAERLNLLDMLFITGIHSRGRFDAEGVILRRWHDAVASLPDSPRSMLIEKVLRMHECIAALVFLPAPIAVLVLSDEIPRRWSSSVLQRLTSRIIDSIDVTAYAHGVSGRLAAAV